MEDNIMSHDFFWIKTDDKMLLTFFIVMSQNKQDHCAQVKLGGNLMIANDRHDIRNT